MLKFLRLIVAFLVASLIAGFLAWASVVHRNLAGAEKALASGRLEVAEEAYESVSEDIKNVRILFPVISDEIVSRQAAISYWKGEYEKNVRNISSGRELVDDVNFGQALAAVNSVVRIGAEKGDIKSVLDSLDRAISLYEQMMSVYGDKEDVAFNYEYLIKRRDQWLANEEVAIDQSSHLLGREGGLPEDYDGELDEVHIFVPMRVDELEMIEEPTIGTDETIRRRG